MSSTGLGPERSNIASDGAVESIDPAYKLRPEVVESLHVMYQITHEAAYRRKAWDIFESIKAHCQTSSGFSGLLSVESGEQDDAQPSFFIAETLKYLYLTMKGPSDVLDNFVFSTEGHLLTKEERCAPSRRSRSISLGPCYGSNVGFDSWVHFAPTPMLDAFAIFFPIALLAWALLRKYKMPSRARKFCKTNKM